MQRISPIPNGFVYRDGKGVDHVVLWHEIQEVSWYEPPYGPLGSSPYWSIRTSKGVLEIEDWWKGSDELLMLFVENLRGFTSPPKAHEYVEQPAEGHQCWKSLR